MKSGQHLIEARGIRCALWFFRGLYILKSGPAEEAIQNFKQAIGHRPQTWNVDAFEDCLANAYLRLGRFDEAIAEYQRIERLNPNYPLVHYHLAQAYERKGQHDRARREYARFFEVWKAADADIPELVSARKALETRQVSLSRSGVGGRFLKSYVTRDVTKGTLVDPTLSLFLNRNGRRVGI